MTNIVTSDTKKALQVVLAVGEAIKAAGPTGVPSGHLYAMLMGHMPTMTADNYQTIIQTLKNVGVVKEASHLLTWCGK